MCKDSEWPMQNCFNSDGHCCIVFHFKSGRQSRVSLQKLRTTILYLHRNVDSSPQVTTKCAKIVRLGRSEKTMKKINTQHNYSFVKTLAWELRKSHSHFSSRVPCSQNKRQRHCDKVLLQFTWLTQTSTTSMGWVLPHGSGNSSATRLCWRKKDKTHRKFSGGKETQTPEIARLSYDLDLTKM